MKYATATAFVLLVTAWSCTATAMQFRLAWNAKEKINVIIGEGPIIGGDAARLEKVIPRAGRDRFGNIPLYLDSPGGSVEAAFELVRVMDHHEFSALVGSGARCASACASVVFISARFHTLLGTGLLGIHTCYVRTRERAVPASFCNEKIARNAIAHGTSYGVIQGYQRRSGPDEMTWFGQDVACKFGLCGPPGFESTLAIPSFDCSKASHASEKAICADKRLARHEAELAKKYRNTMSGLTQAQKRQLRTEQRKWLKYRDACAEPGIIRCLLDRMSARYHEITERWDNAQN